MPSGLGVRSSSATADRIIPGTQYPHCMAPTATKASCTKCNFLPRLSPSTVMTDLPATLPSSVMHDRTALPSKRTVQAPH